MNAPSFWYQAPGLWSFLLKPASWCWHVASKIREFFSKPISLSVPSICVGNINIGGAGKTPTCIKLAQLLKAQGHNPHIISKGYGRSSKDLINVNPKKHTAIDVGDEPLLLALEAPTWVGPCRKKTAQKAIENGATFLIFDDGLQSFEIRYSHKIIVVDGTSGFGNGLLIPSGPLRETISRAQKNCDACILIGNDKHNIGASLSHHMPIFKAHIDPLFDASQNQRYLAFCGLALPEKFLKTLQQLDLNITSFERFSDHHMYKKEELESLFFKAKKLKSKLLTTQKDHVKLTPLWRKRVDFVPIVLTFNKEKTILDFLKKTIA